MISIPTALRPLLVVLVLAAPALAQSSAEAPPPVEQPAEARVDSALVGAWTLDEVSEPGLMAAYGVRVQAMTCQFTADGRAEIVMTAMQDGEAIVRDRAFDFETAGGQIVSEEDGDAVGYRILDDGALELTDDGMVVRFVRAAP